MAKERRKVSAQTVDAAVSTVDAIASAFLTVSPFAPIVAIKRSYTEFKEKAFIRKLETFIEEAGSTTEEEKEKFIKALDTNPEEFQEWLMTLIDRLEDVKKTAIVGRMFKAYRAGKLKRNEFTRLCSIVDNNYLDSIMYLARIGVSGRSFEDVFDTVRMRSTPFNAYTDERKILVALGLLSEHVEIFEKVNKSMSSSDGKLEQKLTYKITDLGQKLLQNGLVEKSKQQ